MRGWLPTTTAALPCPGTHAKCSYEPGRTQSCASRRCARAPARDGAADAVFAVARGAVTQGWLGVTAVTVADEHRRQRHGTRLMSELAVWGAQRGARAIYLQVAADNGPALQLYAGLGFYHHHDYRYRVGSALEERFD